MSRRATALRSDGEQDAFQLAAHLRDRGRIAGRERKAGLGDFNSDYGVSFTAEDIVRTRTSYNYTLQEPPDTESPGVSAFYGDPSGQVFHTYPTYARGFDMLNVAYHCLDSVPKGRDEGDRGPYWVRRRDEYDAP